MHMTTFAERNAAFDAVNAQAISMIPVAFRGMAKPYITDGKMRKITDAARSAAQAAAGRPSRRSRRT